MDLYQQNILDHYKHPEHRGELAEAEFKSTAANPSCGDSVIFFVAAKAGMITKAQWVGEGCVLSQASADLLADHIQGKSLIEIKQLKKEDLFKLVGVELGPNRSRCALLSLEALQTALNSN
jgi:nitrogen fixation NifU-like protein